MKNLIYLTVISIFVSIAAYAASEDPNDVNPQGATAVVKGIGCELCDKYTSTAQINAGKGYDSLLPDSASNGSGTNGAEGSK